MLKIFISVAVLALSIRAVEGTMFTIKAESGKETCLAIPTPPKETSAISLTYELIDEVLPMYPVQVKLFSPHGTPIYISNRHSKSGQFSESGSRGGKYRLCVSNGTEEGFRPDGKDRQVGVSIRIKNSLFQQLKNYDNDNNNNNDDNKKEGKVDPNWESEAEKQKIERTKAIADLTTQLSEKIDVLNDHLSYLQVRHQLHEDLSRQTSDRVLKWNMFQGLALVIVSVGQILAIRKVVEKRRYV